MKGELLREEYTTAVTGEELYDILGSTALRDYELYIYKNSDSKQYTGFDAKNLVRTNDRDLPGTGNGILTQVFVDTQAEEITISIIDTYLARAVADYNDRRETLTVEVYNDIDDASKGAAATEVISVDDIPAVTNYAEDDFMLVTMSDGDVQTVSNVEILSEVEVTRFSQSGGQVTKLTADGTQYDGAELLYFDTDTLDAYDQDNLKDKTYNVYLDQCGYAIGVELFSGEANYVFITGYDRTESNLALRTATANAIFLDGTMANITVNVSDTNDNLPNTADADGYADWRSNGDPADNHWYTYTTSGTGSDAVYTLDRVDGGDGVLYTDGDNELKINSASVRLTQSGERAYGNDDSVYIAVETGAVDTGRGITKLEGVYTGVQDVDLIIPALDSVDKADADNPPYSNGDSEPFFSSNAFVLYDEDLYIIGAVVVNVQNTGTDDYVYVLDNADEEWIEDGDYFWSFQGITPEGQIDTFTVREDYDVFHDGVSNKIDEIITSMHGAMIRVTYDSDGYITDAVLMQDTAAGGTDVVYGNHDWGTEVDTDLHEVYDMAYGTAAELYRVGRTLYADYTPDNRDVGLTTTTGCTFIVIQEEVDSNGNSLGWDYESYGTMQQALDALDDADAFTGNVTALLNERGTAEYLVLNSDDSVGIGTEGDHGTSKGDMTLSNLGIVPAEKNTVGELNITVTNNSSTSMKAANCEVEITVTNERGVSLFHDTQKLSDLTADGKGLNQDTTKVLTFDYNGSQAASGDYTVTVTVTDTVTDDEWTETTELALA